jgi:sulfur-carrier protein
VTTVLVRLPAVLADDAGGRRTVPVSLPTGTATATVGEVLDALAAHHPRLDRRVRDETGALRRHVNVFVGGDDVRASSGLDTPVAAGDTVTLLPSVAGG